MSRPVVRGRFVIVKTRKNGVPQYWTGRKWGTEPERKIYKTHGRACRAMLCLPDEQCPVDVQPVPPVKPSRRFALVLLDN